MDAKVRYENKTYIIQEIAGETIRIKSDDEEFCIHKDNVKPVNKEARECIKRNAGND